MYVMYSNRSALSRWQSKWQQFSNIWGLHLLVSRLSMSVSTCSYFLSFVNSELIRGFWLMVDISSIKIKFWKFIVSYRSKMQYNGVVTTGQIYFSSEYVIFWSEVNVVLNVIALLFDIVDYWQIINNYCMIAGAIKPMIARWYACPV